MDEHVDAEPVGDDRERQADGLEPVDIQRLLVWYFDAEDPGRPHISVRRAVPIGA